jgi:hypothetical protein
VLACAALFNRHRDAPELLREALARSRAAQRLGMRDATSATVLADSASELAMLRAALGQ